MESFLIGSYHCLKRFGTLFGAIEKHAGSSGMVPVLSLIINEVIMTSLLMLKIIYILANFMI